MTYFESAEGERVSRKGAINLLRKHGIPEVDHALFFSEMGEKEDYDAQDVLRWLGY